jgi:hypothetical protein
MSKTRTKGLLQLNKTNNTCLHCGEVTGARRLQPEMHSKWDLSSSARAWRSFYFCSERRSIRWTIFGSPHTNSLLLQRPKIASRKRATFYKTASVHTNHSGNALVPHLLQVHTMQLIFRGGSLLPRPCLQRRMPSRRPVKVETRTNVPQKG